MIDKEATEWLCDGWRIRRACQGWDNDSACVIIPWKHCCSNAIRKDSATRVGIVSLTVNNPANERGDKLNWDVSYCTPYSSMDLSQHHRSDTFSVTAGGLPVPETSRHRHFVKVHFSGHEHVPVIVTVWPACTDMRRAALPEERDTVEIVNTCRSASPPDRTNKYEEIAREWLAA